MSTPQQGENSPEKGLKQGSNGGQPTPFRRRRPLEPVLLAAPVAGWPAVVIDALLDRHLSGFLDQATPERRLQLDRTRRAVHTAAMAWRDHSTSASGSAETHAAAIEAPSGHEQLSVPDVAAALQLSDRRVRQLAERWQSAGLARKVGRTWLIDRAALALADASTAETA